MGIIRDSPKDWTAELTEKDQVAWLVGHNKIIPEKAIEITETNKNQMFCCFLSDCLFHF